MKKIVILTFGLVILSITQTSAVRIHEHISEHFNNSSAFDVALEGGRTAIFQLFDDQILRTRLVQTWPALSHLYEQPSAQANILLSDIPQNCEMITQGDARFCGTPCDTDDSIFINNLFNTVGVILVHPMYKGCMHVDFPNIQNGKFVRLLDRFPYNIRQNVQVTLVTSVISYNLGFIINTLFEHGFAYHRLIKNQIAETLEANLVSWNMRYLAPYHIFELDTQQAARMNSEQFATRIRVQSQLGLLNMQQNIGLNLRTGQVFQVTPISGANT